MRKSKAFTLMALMAVLGAALLAGCSGGSGSKTGPSDNTAESAKEDRYNNEPVTLRFYSHNAGILSDADLETLVGAPLRAKYPNITLELIKGTTLDKMIAAGEVPDFIATSNYYLHDVLQLGLGTDLSGFVKSQGIDMSKFEPEAVNVLKSFGKNGELYGIPYAMNYGVVAYNKDIFDKFGVPYPKDGMTWSQVLELARQVTRTDQGNQYIGFDMGDPQLLTRAYSLPVVDEKQEKAVLTSEGYQKVFGLYRQLYDIPGIVDSNKKYTYGIDAFLKDQKVAMFPYWISALTARLPQLKEPGKDFNWDVVSFPSFDDKPGLGREIDFHLAMVPPGSSNKKAAYAVIESMISNEAQLAMNRSGSRLTILSDASVRNQFAADAKLYDGKNLLGIFAVKPAPLPEATAYDVKSYSFLKEGIKSMINDGKDINTALREANEKADKYIQEMKTTQ
ncbi:Putative ABC transporter substrate-binding protein YesO [Paenibacillus konkukensis]|uniref:ABC transporter substrate-binding protein YesO n=1 Tax=Paenibacillus konkukensis TaxID=2020716 RepID=A0ABY4RKE2_9BACL|nr:extracellular solute-binding protein [Paenibacillus konkukensis]UQZ82613.1 Putative ABC transporter substrate-binding protein YesO [Paenibacillus konkukensis]